jgi:hypothetical protein
MGGGGRGRGPAARWEEDVKTSRRFIDHYFLSNLVVKKLFLSKKWAYDRIFANQQLVAYKHMIMTKMSQI